MRIEFTQAEIEAIIMDHIKNEIAPYVTFMRNPDNNWNLPDTIIVESAE
jgi:hypothetical protein